MTKFNEDNVIAHVGKGVYGWYDIVVFYLDGRYYLDSQGGCSCNSYEWPDDLGTGYVSQQEVIHEAHKEMAEMTYTYDANDSFSIAEQVRKFHPPLN